MNKIKKTDRPETVILVDRCDREIGIAEKLFTHQQGLLHRAFSIFILSPDYKKLLIQKRAKNKYHSGGLWSNSCCGHPRATENLLSAAMRRLKEELGITKIDLKQVDRLEYRAAVNNLVTNLIEHEIDYLFLGIYPIKSAIRFNLHEVDAVEWIELAKLDDNINNISENYTPWLKITLNYIKKYINNINK